MEGRWKGDGSEMARRWLGDGSEKNAPWFLSLSKDAPMRLAAASVLKGRVRDRHCSRWSQRLTFGRSGALDVVRLNGMMTIFTKGYRV